MSVNPIKVMIAGHSFIANLKSYIRKNLCADINFSLGLDPREIMIQYSDRRGGSLETFRQYQLESVKDFEPEIVVLQLGSNDLCNPEQSVGNFTDTYHSVINDLITE